MACKPCGETLSFNVAYWSLMPFPENALISGNWACNAGSKLEALKISNCSICPSALGKEITVECVEALPTVLNTSVRKGVKFRSNNLKSSWKCKPGDGFVGSDPGVTCVWLPVILGKQYCMA